jgi:hypothetical protein
MKLEFEPECNGDGLPRRPNLSGGRRGGKRSEECKMQSEE